MPLLRNCEVHGIIDMATDELSLQFTGYSIEYSKRIICEEAVY